MLTGLSPGDAVALRPDSLDTLQKFARNFPALTEKIVAYPKRIGFLC
jgi:hypothetical protein